MKDVTRRHCAFYHFGRTLSEAIHYFGDTMQSKELVYHGLNRDMIFGRFSHHFVVPIVTSVPGVLGMCTAFSSIFCQNEELLALRGHS